MKYFLRKECFCGQMYGNYGELDKSFCLYPCIGDHRIKCGGLGSNDVYLIKLPLIQIENDFIDNSSNLDLVNSTNLIENIRLEFNDSTTLNNSKTTLTTKTTSQSQTTSMFSLPPKATSSWTKINSSFNYTTTTSYANLSLTSGSFNSSRIISSMTTTRNCNRKAFNFSSNFILVNASNNSIATLFTTSEPFRNYSNNSTENLFINISLYSINTTNNSSQQINNQTTIQTTIKQSTKKKLFIPLLNSTRLPLAIIKQSLNTTYFNVTTLTSFNSSTTDIPEMNSTQLVTNQTTSSTTTLKSSTTTDSFTSATMKVSITTSILSTMAPLIADPAYYLITG